MIILDFLFYYLALYFIKRPQALTWSSPEERASYALGLISTSWLTALEFLIFIKYLKAINQNYFLLNIVFALGFISIYNYIYIKKNRFQFLRQAGNKFHKWNDNLCMVVSWIILLISFGLPFAVLILNMPSDK